MLFRSLVGEHIDLGLLDSQVAWLTYEGMNYLTSGKVPKRQGSEHPNIVPYKTMPCADGYFILAVGNDGQFARFCSFAGCPELAEDARFLTNALRVENRAALYGILPEITRHKTQQHWVEGLAGLGVPAGPVNTLDQVFADPQVLARDMKVSMPYRGSAKGEVDLIGNPIRFSETPVEYRFAPPRAGQDSDAILEELLDLGPEARARLRGKGII